MRYRRIGKWGVKVSEVSLGNWLTQGAAQDQSATIELVKTAWDAGINFFDTADVYQGGAAETVLGVALKDYSRDDLFVATKCFWPMSEAVNNRGLSRKHVIESVNNSLRRLQMDYVDLMQCHRFDPEVPLEETVYAMDTLMRQGKILYWGVSVWEADQIAEVCLLADQLGVPRPISNQPPYNMLNRHIESRVIPTSERFGLGQVVFSPLAQGLLTGKYLPGQSAPEGSRGATEGTNRWIKDSLADDAQLIRIQSLKAFVETQGYDLPSFALAWCLRQANLSSVIIGATRPDQITQNVKAASLDISAEVFEKAEEILAA
jgi:voltage-dependent potassium channel beta subunit